MKTNQFYVFLSLAFIAMSFSSMAEMSYLTSEELLQMYDSTVSQIKNISISYTKELVEKPTGENIDANVFDGATKIQHIKRVEEGEKYFIQYSTDSEGFDNIDSVMLHAFNGTRTKELLPKEKIGSIKPGKTGRNVEVMNDLYRFMLINKLESDIITKDHPEGLEYFKLVVQKQGVVRPELEEICGQWCHVIDSYNSNDMLLSTIWMSVESGGLPLKFIKYKNGKKRKTIEVQEVGLYQDDFISIAYPKMATRENEYMGQKVKYEFNCTDFAPNVQVKEDTFDFEFPNGTRVIDSVVGVFYTTGVGEIESSGVPISMGVLPEKTKNDKIDLKHNISQKTSESQEKMLPTAIENREVEKGHGGDDSINEIYIVSGLMVCGGATCLVFFFLRKRK